MACAGVTPGFRCPTISNIQWIPRPFKSFSPDNCSWFTMGKKISGAKNKMVPWNPGGATPRMVNGCLLSRTTRPTTVRSS